MGLFQSLKGRGPEYIGGDPQPSSNEYADDQTSTHEVRRFDRPEHLGSRSAPSQKLSEYEPPPGPPPSRVNHVEQDPTWSCAHPPGPPPSHPSNDNPPPYHDWTSVPDTSLLPPPPALGHQSSSNNATRSEANRAHAFCDHFPPYTPSTPASAILESVRSGDIVLQQPREYCGVLQHIGRGVWRGKTMPTCQDCILLSTLPLYFSRVDSPLVTERTRWVYFEICVIGMGQRGCEDAGIAIGYCAKPYPTWRLPGWQRASLGVHGDDGRRFVNDTWGGKDFTVAFKPGETVGIGMIFSMPADGRRGGGKAHAEAFFTRDGRRVGGWMIDEELDQESEGVEGLSGELDLYSAIGIFGAVDFEAYFGPERWLYQPKT